MRDPRHIEAHRPFRADGELGAFLARARDATSLDLSGCSLGDHHVEELRDAGLGHLERLRLDYNFLREGGVAALWASPFLLRELGLRGNEIEDAGWKSIATSDRAGDLESLDLADSFFEAVSISDFVGTTLLGKLRSLDWSGLPDTAIDEDTAGALRNAAWMRSISRLGMDRSSAYGPVLSRLLDTPLFDELAILSLRRNQLLWSDLQDLAGARVAQTLVELDVRDNDLGVPYEEDCWSFLGAMKLLRAFHFGAPRGGVPFPLEAAQWAALVGQAAPHLRGFAACNAALAREAIAVLASADWPHLDSLDLSDNPIGDDGLQRLVTSSFITRARSLVLSGCRLGESSVAALLACGAKLVTLDLSRNALGSAAARLLTSGAAAQLQKVVLADTGLTDGDLATVATSTFLGALRTIDVSLNGISPAGIDALIRAEHFPSLERIRLSVPATWSETELDDLHDRSLARGVALQPCDNLSHAETGG